MGTVNITDFELVRGLRIVGVTCPVASVLLYYLSFKIFSLLFILAWWLRTRGLWYIRGTNARCVLPFQLATPPEVRLANRNPEGGNLVLPVYAVEITNEKAWAGPGIPLTFSLPEASDAKKCGFGFARSLLFRGLSQYRSEGRCILVMAAGGATRSLRRLAGGSAHTLKP